MKANLDAKDRKILYELDINSRQASSEIAKKVGLSKQVVNFRIKRLIKEKLISFFYTVIDISKLGFTVHKIFLRLQNIDSEKEKALINFLVKHHNVLVLVFLLIFLIVFFYSVSVLSLNQALFYTLHVRFLIHTVPNICLFDSKDTTFLILKNLFFEQDDINHKQSLKYLLHLRSMDRNI